MNNSSRKKLKYVLQTVISLLIFTFMFMVKPMFDIKGSSEFFRDRAAIEQSGLLLVLASEVCMPCMFLAISI